jgi:pimeloyl-ACP methyl ester carboxylesterase
MKLTVVSIGGYPCLVGGSGDPLVVLPGLAPESGLGSGLTRLSHNLTARSWARYRRVYYINRRPRMPTGITMSEIAAEHANVLREAFDGPVDVLGMSTGGSIAQQLAAEHPDVVRSLALMSTACRLGGPARSVQRRVAARIRAGALREAAAVFAADLVPPGPLELPAAVAGWLWGPSSVTRGGLDDLATMIDAEDPFDLATLPAIAAPTVLVAGGRDRFYGRSLFQETADMIPGCRLEIHPRDGHVSVMSRPSAVAQVLGFLTAQSSRSDSPGAHHGQAGVEQLRPSAAGRGR